MVNGANRPSARPSHDIERRNGSLPIGELSGVENLATGVMRHACAPRRAVSDTIRSRNAYGMGECPFGQPVNVLISRDILLSWGFQAPFVPNRNATLSPAQPMARNTRIVARRWTTAIPSVRARPSASPAPEGARPDVEVREAQQERVRRQHENAGPGNEEPACVRRQTGGTENHSRYHRAGADCHPE